MSLHQPVCAVVPRPRQLRLPLLVALGEHTHYQPNVFVAMDAVLDDVVRAAGFDPDNLPEGWGDRKSRSNGGKGGGLDRNIQLAFRYSYRDMNPALTIKGSQAGLWGLTEAGAAFALSYVSQGLPATKTLVEPLLRALGKMSGHTLESVPRLDLTDSILIEAGYVDALPPSWRQPASNGQPRIIETIRWVARSIPTLLHTPQRGLWALTPEGLTKAALLNGEVIQPEVLVVPVEPPAPAGPNATARWFNRHLTPAKGQRSSDLMTLLRASICRKLPVSARRDMVDDHINTFIMKSIQRDALAERLAQGEEIPYEKVASYCVRSGCSDVRDMGTEPVCREMYGARTVRERGSSVEREISAAPSLLHNEGEDGFRVASSGEENEFNALWADVVDVVKSAKPSSWQRYTSAIALRAQGCTTSEIADQMGTSNHQASKMLRRARQIIATNYESDVA